MNELLSKISSYHLFNYLLPGSLFAVVATELTHRQFVQQNLVLGLFVYYFYGLIISRIGSLFVEPFLKWVRFVRFAEYRDFVAACKKDPKIDELSETNNMYRTLCTLLITLILLGGIVLLEERYPGLKRAELPTLTLVVFGLLLFSYKKQTGYITKRVKANVDAQ
ncbi:hypothetical protein [Occallatibacter savannae]|uniref:hypothetical protein n=1 Tax=Occallatibacter savannae TaxID=1002691 RepID=UPI000D69AD07|nr:hypothetical protein [Occallatibacter savannae]